MHAFIYLLHDNPTVINYLESTTHHPTVAEVSHPHFLFLHPFRVLRSPRIDPDVFSAPLCALPGQEPRVSESGPSNSLAMQISNELVQILINGSEFIIAHSCTGTPLM